MSFFHPERLLFGLSAILILLLYLGWRRTRIEVSTAFLWRKALARRGAWRRWQRPMSASLLILIMILLAAALAEPYWRRDLERARTIVVVLSNSASMRATDVAPDRLSRARDQARRLIDDLRPYEQMAVLTAGGPVRVRCSFTGDAVALRRAIDAVEPTDAGENVGEAIDLGRWMLAGQRNPGIVVLSDGGFRGAKELASADDVTLVMPQQEGDAAAKAPVNYAITRLAARANQKSAGCELFVEVGNFSPREAKVPLAIAAAGVPEQKATLIIPAGEVVGRVFPLANFSQGMITAKLDIADDLAADNEARLMVAPEHIIVGESSGPYPPLYDDRPPVTHLTIPFPPQPVLSTTTRASNSTAEAAQPANPLDRQESDLRTPSGVQGKPLPISSAERREPPGRWLLLLVIGLCGGEWILFRRRKTV